MAYALNRKIAIYNSYYYGSKDTLNLIKDFGKEIFTLEDKITNKEIIAYTKNELANIEDYKGNKSKAIKMYEEALDYAKQNNLLNPEIDISYNLALIYSRYKNNPFKSIQVLEAIKPKVVNANNLFQKYQLFLNLKNHYSAVQDYKKAFKASVNAYDYAQEYNGMQTGIKLKEIEKRFDITKKEKQLQEKESEIKIQNLEIKSSSKRFWLVFVIFILSSIGVFVLVFFLKREKKSNKELLSLSQENKFLLSEANHRINNNLQLIIILISEQINKLEDNQQTEIKNILSKIESIATLHKHLYKNQDKTKIDSKKYFNDIYLNFNSLLLDKNIQVSIEIDSILLQTDTAMYLGLLLTELFINTIKHAFVNQDNKVISFKLKLKNNTIYFHYSDNGKTLNGRLILSQNLESKPNQLNLSKLQRGLYIFKIKSQEGQKINRVIIE